MQRLAATILGCLALCAANEVASAQSYAAGYAKNQRGDCQGAERALTLALPPEPHADARARILKLLAICAYARGDLKTATATFRQALALAPRLDVEPDEVLDESVIGFFKSVRAQPGAANAAAADKRGAGMPLAPGASVPKAHALKTPTEAATPEVPAPQANAGTSAAPSPRRKRRPSPRAMPPSAPIGDEAPAAPETAFGDDP